MREPEDLIKFGLIPELIGRLPVVATLQELEENALVQILTEPKNALIKQYQKLFGMEEVELEIRSGALSAIAKKHLPAKQEHAVCVQFSNMLFSIQCTNFLVWKMSKSSHR